MTVASRILPCALTTSPAATIAAFSASMNGVRYATAFFITRADLTTCGRNILPAPNRSPTTLMPSISGPSMTEERAAEFDARFFGVGLDVGVDALHQRVREALLDGAVAPLFGLLLGGDGACACGLQRFAEVDEALGRVGAAVEQHVFDQHFQLGLDLFVDLEHAGVDDAHVHAGARWRDRGTRSAWPRGPCCCRGS